MVNKKRRNMLRRIICICLCFSLILLNGISANAVDVHENREDVLLIQEVEHGEFSVMEGHQKSVDSSNSFAVYRIPDVDGLYQDREGSYYLQCTNKTLLRVNQVAVPIEDIEAVEEIASTFSLPEMLVSDLRMLSEAIQNEENAQILVELYYYMRRK